MIDIFRNQLRKKPSHCYLIVGDLNQRKILTQEILEELNISVQDRYFVDSVNKIKIAQIRELQKNIILKPIISNYRLAIINQAENLTLEAANALLKILEEPPKNVIIILFINAKQNILPTIISRCQIIKLPPKLNIPSDEFGNASDELEKIKKMNIMEKFNYAAAIGEQTDLADTLNGWILCFRRKVLEERKNEYIDIIKKLQSSQILAKGTNVNKKLLLENILLLV